MSLNVRINKKKMTWHFIFHSTWRFILFAGNFLKKYPPPINYTIIAILSFRYNCLITVIKFNKISVLYPTTGDFWSRANLTTYPLFHHTSPLASFPRFCCVKNCWGQFFYLFILYCIFNSTSDKKPFYVWFIRYHLLLLQIFCLYRFEPITF